MIYGMYYCMNVVANKKDIPEAVLIRANYAEEAKDFLYRFTIKNNKFISVPIKVDKIN